MVTFSLHANTALVMAHMIGKLSFNGIWIRGSHVKHYTNGVITNSSY